MHGYFIVVPRSYTNRAPNLLEFGTKDYPAKSHNHSSRLSSQNVPDPRFPIATCQICHDSRFSSVIFHPADPAFVLLHHKLDFLRLASAECHPFPGSPLTNSFAYTGSLPTTFLLPISNQIDLPPPSASDRQNDFNLLPPSSVNNCRD
jgi:hypothetical protein